MRQRCDGTEWVAFEEPLTDNFLPGYILSYTNNGVFVEDSTDGAVYYVTLGARRRTLYTVGTYRHWHNIGYWDDRYRGEEVL